MQRARSRAPRKGSPRSPLIRYPLAEVYERPRDFSLSGKVNAMPFGNEPPSLVARIDAQARHPDKILATEQQRDLSPRPLRHARFLKEILQACAGGGEDWAAGARRPSAGALRKRLCLRRAGVDSGAALEAQLAAERGKGQPALAFPFHRGELRARPVFSSNDHLVAVEAAASRRRARYACARRRR